LAPPVSTATRGVEALLALAPGTSFDVMVLDPCR
jgi:hypothetical protein